MNYYKWISITLFIVLIAGLAGTGFVIFKKSANSDEIKNASSPSLATRQSGLEVTDNTGLGGGTESKAQNISETSTTENSTTTTQATSNFTEYEKYKDAKVALFGEVKEGDSTIVKEGDTVQVYYKGYLTNGTVFDNQWPAKAGDRPKPFEFTVGKSNIVAGIHQGIVGMKVGGTRRIIIPPSVGYGEKGQGAIPPDSVLVMDVELLNIKTQ